MSIFFVAVIRSALAAILVVAGSAKLSGIDSFARTLRAVKLGPAKSSHAAAAIIALAEISLGVALVGSEPNLVVDVLVALLMAAFVVVAIRGARLDKPIACRCFGALTERRFGNAAITQASVLLLLALTAVTIEIFGSVSPSPPSIPTLLPTLAEYALLGMVSAQASRSLAKTGKGVSLR
jgi:uncharacterized membrane protein YphA (DoxX/SURF4 family)